MEDFSGFYPSRPFWAGNGLELTESMPSKVFKQQMSEIVFEKDHGGISVKISRDGQILIRSSELESKEGRIFPTPTNEAVERLGAYLDYMNCFYLLLDSALVETQNICYFNLHEITTRDIFRVTIKDGIQTSWSVPTESIASVFQSARDPHSYSSDLPTNFDHRIRSRYVVNLETISTATDRFFSAISRSGASKDLASLAKSISEYKTGNYETAILMAWFVTESIVNHLWITHLKSLNTKLPGGRMRVNRDRRDDLTRQFQSVSAKSTLLELFGVLDFSTLEIMDKVRTYRNNVAHRKASSLDSEMTQQAISLANDMIARRWQLDLIPNLSFTLMIL